MVSPLPALQTPSSDSDVGTPARITSTEPDDLDIRTVNGKVYQFPADKPLYSAHGKWAWVNDHDILSGDAGTPLGYGLEGHVILKAGLINETQVVYISKMTSVWDRFRMFFASLYLNASSKYLRPLQGDCVPWIIGVRHCLGGRVGVAQDLPHPTGWREADMFLKESQKEAIIAAYQKLHDRGILHGDAEYRHMLIGDDGKVTIIDFGLSSVLNPDAWARKAGLDGCSRLSLRIEMRKVKFLLDWKDSRETELRLAKLRSAREERDRAAADAVLKNKTDPFEIVEAPKEAMSEEEKEYPDGGVRLCDLKLWSSGDTWVAHHYEVERRAYRAVLKKTEIPRQSKPQETTESTNTVASVVPATAEPVPALGQVPAIQLTPAVPAGATNPPTPSVSSLGKGPFEGEPEKEPEEEQKEQKNVGTEGTGAIPLRHGKTGENDRPMRKRPAEHEQEQEQKEQKIIEEKHTKVVPLRHGKASDKDVPEKEPEQKEQKKVNGEHATAVPLNHGKFGESYVPARKRPFEDEPEKRPEKQKNDNVKLSMSVSSRHGMADHSNEPSRKCSSAEGPEKEPEAPENTNIDRTKAVPLRHGKSDHSGPARKRQRTTGASVTPTLNPLSVISSVEQPSDTEESSLDDSMSSSANSDLDDTMKIPLLDDDAADPTPYELNPEACAFLRGEAARGFARFTTAKTRVLPLERQLDQENHSLEKHRSELLRIMLMLPREDRTTLWTNMGQPDVRTLLGLLPETPGSSQSTRDLINIQTQLARSEAASMGNSSNRSSMPSRELDLGFLAVQKVQAKTGSKQKLHERLEIERKMDSLAMPPPQLPVEIVTSTTTSLTSITSPMAQSLQRNPSQGITSESSPFTLPGPTCSESTNAAQSFPTPHVHLSDLKRVLEEAHKANPNSVFSVSIPPEALALEAKATRKYTIVEGSSEPPPGEAFVRTPAAFYNMEPIDDKLLTAIKVLRASKESEAKRKREVMDSEGSETMHVADEPPDAKRRKTNICNML